jgi:hypothetical protein
MVACSWCWRLRPMLAGAVAAGVVLSGRTSDGVDPHRPGLRLPPRPRRRNGRWSCCPGVHRLLAHLRACGNPPRACGTCPGTARRPPPKTAAAAAGLFDAVSRTRSRDRRPVNTRPPSRAP